MTRKGFTLVELVISLAILSCLISGMLYVFSVDLKIWNKITARCQDRQINNFVLSSIIRDVRAADKVLAGSGYALLRLNVGPDVIEYSIANDKVKRSKSGYATYLTDVGEIRVLNFSYPSSRLVGIALGDLSTVAGLRNYNE